MTFCTENIEQLGDASHVSTYCKRGGGRDVRKGMAGMAYRDETQLRMGRH
jgi:hypothetical protein